MIFIISVGAFNSEVKVPSVFLDLVVEEFFRFILSIESSSLGVQTSRRIIYLRLLLPIHLFYLSGVTILFKIGLVSKSSVMSMGFIGRE